MSIQLTFDAPLTISSKELDEIRVTFKVTELIYDEFGQELEAKSFLQKEIPPQYANAAEAKVFDSLKEVVSTVETGTFASNMVFNAIIAIIL